MALCNGVSNIVRQTIINNEMSVASPFMTRCMSSWTLFVGGLGRDTTDTRLREAFSAYGEVSEAKVVMDRKSAMCRGFGFVTFADHDSAWNAMDTMDQWEFRGQTVTVNWSKATMNWMKDKEGEVKLDSDTDSDSDNESDM